LKNIKRFIITLLLSLIIGTTFSVVTMYTNYRNACSQENLDALQESLSDKLLRFHVIANSDSLEDQNLKLQVKQSVADYIEELLCESESLAASKAIINEHNENILRVAEDVIRNEGFNYDVTGEISEDTYFPLKTYGDITLPSGEYCAYRLVIGDGEGANWWCILYPPLCFVDISTGVVPDSSKEQLSDILDEDEFSLITTGKPANMSFKFKYLTFLNGLFD